MAPRIATCPYCEAEIPLEKEDKEGDEVYCSYCQMRLKLETIDGKLEAIEEEEEG
jgi:uncharacterized Zn-finger protein